MTGLKKTIEGSTVNTEEGRTRVRETERGRGIESREGEGGKGSEVTSGEERQGRDRAVHISRFVDSLK